MKVFSRLLLFISLTFCLSLKTQAWGVTGHRVVGQIAETYLTKNAKAAIDKILGHESLAMAANWGDFIKSDTTYKYLSPWHYLDLDSGLTHDALVRQLASDTAANVYNRINFLVAELKKPDLQAAQKQMYLRLLIHLVGDIHQPMHTGRTADQGGNKIKLLWFNTPTNLHQVWDERLIDFQQLSYTEYANAINFSTAEERRTLQKEPMAEWVWKSYNLAQQIYADVTGPDQKLDYKYNFKYQQILNLQLLEGGIHLAGILNDIFK